MIEHIASFVSAEEGVIRFDIDDPVSGRVRLNAPASHIFVESGKVLFRAHGGEVVLKVTSGDFASVSALKVALAE